MDFKCLMSIVISQTNVIVPSIDRWGPSISNDWPRPFGTPKTPSGVNNKTILEKPTSYLDHLESLITKKKVFL